jgi:hypothetical protein
VGETQKASRLEIAQAFVMHVGHRDFDRGMSLLSPTVSYKVVGYRGLEQGLSGCEAVTKHLIELAERTGGAFESLKWEDWLVGGDHIAVIAKILIEVSGQRVVTSVLFLIRFDADDKIAELIVFPEDVRSIERVLGA